MKRILISLVALAFACAGAMAQEAETVYAKSDFVPGDEIFFDDPVENEKLGEFPHFWDFLGGEECEIITLNGEQVIKLSGWFTDIAPPTKAAPRTAASNS